MRETRPICACCLEPVSALWRVTQPKVYVLCGSGNCERWAWAQGLTYYAEGKVRAPRRRKKVVPTCYACREPLRKDRAPFLHNDLTYCTLTCLQRLST